MGFAKKAAKADRRGQHPEYTFGVFVSEGNDPELSDITVLGESVEDVPKLRHVTGLTNGDNLLLVRSKLVPLTIIGALDGDTTED